MFISLFKDHFNLLTSPDYGVFYQAGKEVFNFNIDMYDGTPYYYLPSFATIFSVFTLIDFATSQWIWLFLLLFFGIISMIEFDRILKFNKMNLLTRFFILMVISNGLKLMQGFDYLQPKIVMLYLFAFFIRREIEIRNNLRKDDLRFKIIQYIILSFIIGINPSFFFFIFIYLLYNVNSVKDIFGKEKIKDYTIFLIIFLLQNIIFLIHPSLIISFLKNGIFDMGNSPFYTLSDLTYNFVLEHHTFLPQCPLAYIGTVFSMNRVIIGIISMILSAFFSIVIIIKQNLSLEKKLGLFFLVSLLFNIYLSPTILITILPFIILLLFPDSKFQDDEKYNNFIDYIRKNINVLIGLLFFSILYFMPDLSLVYRIFPFTINIPIQLLLLGNLYVYLILSFIFYIIYKKRYKERI
ncbi:MAG: hypothetical protein JXA99_11570 [Candidatus Lokiarchaeota archaeon]|nr:hypothetical protein [Candidatus Lokiarchaeota archaeon]